MSKKFIIVDLDGILNLLYPYWFNMYGIDYNVPIDIDKMTDWEVAQFVPHGELIYKYMELPGFYKYVPVMPGAQDGMKLLMEKHNVLVYTACDNLPHAYADKATFLDYNFPGVPKLIGKNHKHRMLADAIIDDSPKNQRAFKATHLDAKVVSIEWPYNKINARSNPQAFLPVPGTDRKVPIVDVMAGSWRNPEASWERIVTYLNEEAWESKPDGSV
jgi:5'-nucleotidase